MLITKGGLEKLKLEIDDLITNQRPKVINDIATAKALGDLSENAEYHAAREKQGMIEARVRLLQNYLGSAEVVDIFTIEDKNTASFGATVTAQDIDDERIIKYKIVSEYEADFAKGLISVISPIARQMIGKKQGDEIEVSTPKGTKYYEIIKVEFI